MTTERSEQLSESEYQEMLITEHADLVKRIAYHLMGRLPSHVDAEDLIQAGMLGLLMAGKNYTSDKGANFTTYAGIRIRGAILDEVRKSDWTPRSVHRKSREISAAARELETTKGSAASDSEICEALGISLAEYQKTVRDQQACRVLSLDAPLSGETDLPVVPSGDELQPYVALENDSNRKELVGGIEGLTDREQQIMSMYYVDELNLREIGEVMAISESRACQIHGQILQKLRHKLADNE